MDPYQIIEKYYKKDTKQYHVLITHSEQVKNMALEIANRHQELKIDSQFVSEAAMLHDIGIFMCFAPKIHCYGLHEYVEHGYLGADLLRKEGFPHHALVCERHTGTGLSLETIRAKKLPLPARNLIPISIEEQVICYADKFYSKSQLEHPHQAIQIRAYLSRFGESDVLKFDEWSQKFE